MAITTITKWKFVRSLKNESSPILTGYQICHNYVRPYMALCGQTPTAKAGVEIRGKTEWFTIIQNASCCGEPKSEFDRRNTLAG
ncbi:MAG: hypothetical protein ABSF63_09455 [Candidatus Bathyarchaeia archaeon]